MSDVEEAEQVNQVDEEGFDPALQDDELEAGLTPERRESEDEPDVLLDVPELRVDEISLEVEDLHARVALRADVLSLLRLHVGVEADLGRVQLTIKGVEAQALLKVRLDNVARIIDRVLTTIDNNPEIVEGLIEQLGQAAEEVGAGTGQALGELAPGAAAAVDEAGKAAETTVEGVDRGAETAARQVAQDTGQAAEKVADEPPLKRPRRSKPRQSTERGAERRGRRSKAGSSGKKRPTRGSRSAPDRRSEEG